MPQVVFLNERIHSEGDNLEHAFLYGVTAATIVLVLAGTARVPKSRRSSVPPA